MRLNVAPPPILFIFEKTQEHQLYDLQVGVDWESPSASTAINCACLDRRLKALPIFLRKPGRERDSCLFYLSRTVPRLLLHAANPS